MDGLRGVAPTAQQLWATDDQLAEPCGGLGLRSVALPQQRRCPSGPGRRLADPGDADRRPDLVLLLSIQEAGRALGIRRSKMYELIAAGELETVHIGRAVRVPVDAIEEFVVRLRSGEHTA
ncbi:MAG: helix-turn-helix domain-containing protein [Actinobacteria bacterium]|nr:helix-turn-helix domain-containing protein [Actinomycetota bacterium]